MELLIMNKILQTILMIFFLISGVGKVFSSPMNVNNFNRMQLPQWFRVVNSSVELIGEKISCKLLIFSLRNDSWIIAYLNNHWSYIGSYAYQQRL